MYVSLPISSSFSPGTILASEPFRPIVATWKDMLVKFYSLAVLSQQDRADACLNYGEKPTPDYPHERGFIVDRGREALGFRDLATNVFDTLHTEIVREIARKDPSNLFDLLGDDISHFSFEEYYRDEQHILKPALEARGYRDVRFFMGEHDSFGPLIREVTAIHPSTNRRVNFWYG